MKFKKHITNLPYSLLKEEIVGPLKEVSATMSPMETAAMLEESAAIQTAYDLMVRNILMLSSLACCTLNSNLTQSANKYHDD